ncbi:MAG: class I tRNA ligase family protein, partial [Gammaproteobacteria bacterium]
VEKIEDHKLMVPRGDRSTAVVEPYLTDQWYVRAETLAKPAIEAVESGRLKFVPANWDKTYFEWMRNIQDWCISRQLWWGHRIPAWYDSGGNVYVADSEAEVRREHNLDDTVVLSQDEDVLDTWFSSALWPFSTLGWPDSTAALKTFYPTSVLVTGFDIIFFWVARMVMMGLKFMGDVPFHEVYIHGLVRDQDGQKMSKSKGNILDPIDLVDGIDLETLVKKRTEGMMQPHLSAKVEKATRRQFPDGIPSFGTDALRFTFASLATTGRDIRFDLGRIEGYRNFCNKLWNASHFVLSNTADYEPGDEQLGVADRWIDSRLNRLVGELDKHYREYRLDLAAKGLYEFVWHEFCDWYLELSKPILNDPQQPAAVRRGTQATLLRSLDGLLRLLHPLMPFVTEALWLEVKPALGLQGESIINQALPPGGAADVESEQEVAWIQAFIGGVRQIRGEMDIGFSQPLAVWLEGPSADDLQRLDRYRNYLTQLARLETIELLGDRPTSGCAASLVGELRLLVPLAGIKDLAAERERLSRAVEKVQRDLTKAEAKLSNASFVERAPAAVVEKERQRVTDMASQVAKLTEQIQRLSA